MEQVARIVEKLRHPAIIGNRAYYELIEKFRNELFVLFKEPNLVVKTVMASLDEQYDMYEGEVPASYHLFEINVLRTFKMDGLRQETVTELCECIFRRLSCQSETYHLLCFFEKIIHKFVIKNKETEILQKLQALVGPSDKKCLKLVISIIEYILQNWDNQNERKSRFEELILLPKWSKLEFYICRGFYKDHVKNMTTFEIILRRIFQGFQENHTAYAAHVLFEKIVPVQNEIYYDIIENYVVCLLEQDNEDQKTLHSSLITYVIPTMAHNACTKFMQQSFAFKAIYKLHMIKYYYYKNYISDIDVEFLNDICNNNSNDNTIITLVWELCCSFSKTDVYIKDEHMRLFMLCIRHHYDGSNGVIQNHIHSFLNQVVICMIRNNRPVYLEFFRQLAKLVNKILDSIQHIMSLYAKVLIDIHLRAMSLMSRYWTLRPKFGTLDTLMYNLNQNPLHLMHEEFITTGWNIFKFYICNGLGNNLYDLIELYRIDYDAPFIYAIRKSLMLGLNNPNLDRLEHIRAYTKILLRMYKDYSKTLELKDLLSDVMNTLRKQHANMNNSQNHLTCLANPIYMTGEALHVIAQEYGKESLIFVFNTCDQIIRDTLPLVNAVADVYTRKSVEQIFITHIQLLKTCTKKLGYTKIHVVQFLYLCEQIMCQTKFRKATSVAYNAALSTIIACRPQLLYKELVNHLIESLGAHLKEVEIVALNRCSGNKDVLLLTFKILGSEPAKFATHFKRMLNVSQGYQELHLVALEAICNDADLKDLTAPYLIHVFKKTISIMAHPSFASRNAATQLIQILANRFMGTKSELGQRPVCIFQAFERHPELAKLCYDALCELNNNSKFGIITFMGDTPYYPAIFGESHQLPINKIEELMNTPGTKILATKAFAMTVNSAYLYSTICNEIKKLQDGPVSACNLLLIEYLLIRFINSEIEEQLISNAIAKFENLLSLSPVADFPDTIKYLKYPNCQKYKLKLQQEPTRIDFEDILGVICKCLFLENFIALSFVCSYIESIFHGLEEMNRQKLFQKLIDVFIEYNGGYLMMRHYYSSIKRLLVYVPKQAVINVRCYDIRHIFIAEIITSILYEKNNLSDSEKDILKNLKDNLPVLLQQCDSFNEELSLSITATLINLLYLFPRIGLQKSDFYYILFIAFFQISNKNKFCKIFKIITKRNCSISYYVQCLPKILKEDLGDYYVIFIRNVAKYIGSNLNHAFVKYSGLYNCSEKYTDVNIDVFLLRMVLKDIKVVL